MGHILHLSLPIRTQEEEKDWLTWAKSLGTGVMCAANLRAFQLPSNWFEETRNVSRAADHLKRTGLGQRLKVADNCWELKVAASMPVPWRNQECFVKIIGSCPSHETDSGIAGTKLNLSLREVDQETGEDKQLSCWVWVDELWLADDQLMNYIVTGCG